MASNYRTTYWSRWKKLPPSAVNHFGIKERCARWLQRRRLTSINSSGSKCIGGCCWVRKCELQLAKSHQRGLVHGACHTYVGQEAVAVGVLAHLSQRDMVFSTHRGHGHALAKGMPAEELIAELYGREFGMLARSRGQYAPLLSRDRHDGHQRHRRSVHSPGCRRGYPSSCGKSRASQLPSSVMAL